VIRRYDIRFEEARERGHVHGEPGVDWATLTITS